MIWELKACHHSWWDRRDYLHKLAIGLPSRSMFTALGKLSGTLIVTDLETTHENIEFWRWTRDVPIAMVNFTCLNGTDSAGAHQFLQDHSENIRGPSGDIQAIDFSKVTVLNYSDERFHLPETVRIVVLHDDDIDLLSGEDMFYGAKPPTIYRRCGYSLVTPL